MPLVLHNTLGGSLMPFIPLHDRKVTFYTCGPTVYDYAHIGNFRSFLVADLLRRWLESPLCECVGPRDSANQGTPTGVFGYHVTHVMNITDVGHMTDDASADGAGLDKMEEATKRLLEDKKSGRLPEGATGATGKPLDPTDPYDIAAYYTRAFIDDAKRLRLKVALDAEHDPTCMPHATQSIKGMLQLILQLLNQNHAYLAEDGACYFDTQSFPDYGALSGNTVEALRAGAGERVSDFNQRAKRSPADFLLWKPDRTHLMRWDPRRVCADDQKAVAILDRFPLHEGYPGWHIECSAMALARLGPRIDLHSGGEDNIFPHHECELAQSRCANHTDQLASFWIHGRFLRVEGQKMSKSKGNFFTARQLFAKGFSPTTVRLELIKTHYRSNSNFTEQGLIDASKQIDRWRTFLQSAEQSPTPGVRNDSVATKFADAMNNDLNIAEALGVLNSWTRDTTAPTQADAQLIRDFDTVLALLEPEDLPTDTSHAGGPDDAYIDDLVRRRTTARAEKNWPEADRLRDELAALEVEVTDTPTGPTWRRRATL
ncbi:MAG: hypothetical protein KDA20_07175 [Phycisphaerales bacterium]|nr:hypothetical protein [Phycisphaerales bacterium]